MTRGWLLDLHPIGKNQVGLWIREENGRTHLHEVRWSPKIYVAGPFEKLVELAKILAQRCEVDFMEKAVKPGRSPETVLEVKVPFGGKRRLAKLILDLGGHNCFQFSNSDLLSI